METQSKEYVTTDFYTAAVLLSEGFKVTSVSTLVGGKKKFHFEDSEKLHRTRMQYTNGDLFGNIRAFRNAIDVVKDMIHSN